MSTFANNLTESFRILEKEYRHISNDMNNTDFINLNGPIARGRVLISTQPLRSTVANNQAFVSRLMEEVQILIIIIHLE